MTSRVDEQRGRSFCTDAAASDLFTARSSRGAALFGRPAAEFSTTNPASEQALAHDWGYQTLMQKPARSN